MISVTCSSLSFTAEPQRTQRQVDFPLPFEDTDQRKKLTAEWLQRSFFREWLTLIFLASNSIFLYLVGLFALHIGFSRKGRN